MIWTKRKLTIAGLSFMALCLAIIFEYQNLTEDYQNTALSIATKAYVDASRKNNNRSLNESIDAFERSLSLEPFVTGFSIYHMNDEGKGQVIAGDDSSQDHLVDISAFLQQENSENWRLWSLKKPFHLTFIKSDPQEKLFYLLSFHDKDWLKTYSNKLLFWLLIIALALLILFAHAKDVTQKTSLRFSNYIIHELKALLPKRGKNDPVTAVLKNLEGVALLLADTKNLTSLQTPINDVLDGLIRAYCPNVKVVKNYYVARYYGFCEAYVYPVLANILKIAVQYSSDNTLTVSDHVDGKFLWVTIASPAKEKLSPHKQKLILNGTEAGLVAAQIVHTGVRKGNWQLRLDCSDTQTAISVGFRIINWIEPPIESETPPDFSHLTIAVIDDQQKYLLDIEKELHRYGVLVKLFPDVISFFRSLQDGQHFDVTIVERFGIHPEEPNWDSLEDGFAAKVRELNFKGKLVLWTLGDMLASSRDKDVFDVYVGKSSNADWRKILAKLNEGNQND